MESTAKLLGHPIHQMVIVFPLGLLTTSAVFEIIGGVTGKRHWSRASYYLLGGGVMTALGSAVPGVIDYLAIPKRTRAKRIGFLHGAGNLLVTGLFVSSWLLRRHRPGKPTAPAISFSLAGTILALVTGWLGGELVDTLGIGVNEHAHVDAPSSLTTLRSASPKIPA
ncbi:MAG: DUF2231 domain-containing protein [Acidobacteria bacterium]|nr:DUF2231 domain-containing protein [Acidobacteriota bacterium]